MARMAAYEHLLKAYDVGDQLHGRDYESFEHELIADWRTHYASAFAKLKDTAVLALRNALDRDRPQDPDAAAELESLASSLGTA